MSPIGCWRIVALGWISGRIVGKVGNTTCRTGGCHFVIQRLILRDQGVDLML